MTMNVLLITLSCLLAVTSCKEDDKKIVVRELKSVTYQPTEEIFPNPERGFYKYSLIEPGSGSGALSFTQVSNYRNSGISLVMRYFYLKNFKDKPLSSDALKEIDNDFETTRRAGIKIIPRFAYSQAQDEPDASLEIIIQHLDQLKPIFEKNSDVIATVQAGFIGSWGEWYYSTNDLYNANARREVIKKLLQVVPKNRTIQVRTPAYKQEYFNRKSALTLEEAFTGSDISRVGHHNDCFLASSTDYGTYENPVVDKAFLNNECLYVPIGGETCPPDGVDPATSTKAQNDMRYLRWTYLNEDYYKGVNNSWITDGGMDNIKRELGYRFQLSSGEYTNNVKPGGLFKSRISIKNLGYAPLYNPRLVELILQNVESGEKYKIQLDVEPRFWHPLENVIIEEEVGLPINIPQGDYKLYLHLPDPEPALYGKPAYSIRLANDNVWEASTGYNNLNITINVSSENMSENYSGEKIFEKI
ncbi:MAG: DUF4832 domain-containing protein [Lascolabacillus sp.]|nr:DUF4832 domain-containing protein [Lascolabacillus sp.]